MNRIFKKVLNKSRGCFVAVSECAKSVSRAKAKAVMLVGVVGLVMGSSGVWAKYTPGESSGPSVSSPIFFFHMEKDQPKREDCSYNGGMSYCVAPSSPFEPFLEDVWNYDDATKAFIEGEGLQNLIMKDKTLKFSGSSRTYTFPYPMGYKATQGLKSIIGNSILRLIGDNPKFLITDSPLDVGGSTEEGSGTLYLGCLTSLYADPDDYGGVAYVHRINGNSSVHVDSGNYRITGDGTADNPGLTNIAESGFLKVYEGATLTLESDSLLSLNGYLNNYGTLNLKQYISGVPLKKEGPEEDLTKYRFKNYGTLNIDLTNASASVGTLENNGVFNYNASVDNESYISNNIKGTGTINIDGKMRVTQYIENKNVNIHTGGMLDMGIYTRLDANWEGQITGKLNAENLNNNGELFVDFLTVENLVNNGTIKDFLRGSLSEINCNDGENNGHIEVKVFNIKGQVNNKGTIYFQEQYPSWYRPKYGAFFENTDSRLHNTSTGTINVAFNDFFKDVITPRPLNTIDIFATEETEVKTVKTKYWADEDITLPDKYKTHITWDVGGNLVLRDTYWDQAGTVYYEELHRKLPQNIWNKAVKLFNDTFGEGTNITYDGTIVEDKVKVFNIATVNTLSDKARVRNVIFINQSLDGEGKEVWASSLCSNGFMSIINAPKVGVGGGSGLTLIGAKSDSPTERTTIAQEVEVTGANYLGYSAKLTLGSLGLKDASQYRTYLPTLTVSKKATLKAVAGDHLITDFNSTNGSSSIGKGAVIKIENPVFNEESLYDNYGDTTFGKLNGNFLTKVNNYGNMVVEGETKFSGQLLNEDFLQLKDNAMFVGTLQNNETGRIYAKTVNVIGSLINNGYMEAEDNSTVNGRVENPGTIILYSVDINKGDSTLTGTVQNTYKLVGTGVANVNGYLKNAPGAVAIFNEADSIINIKEGGSVENAGVLIAKAGEIQGALKTSDLAVLDNVKGTATSSVVARGVLMSDTFSTDGAVLMAKNTQLVIGGSASRTKFLLSNLPIAKRILDAGGEVPQSVKDALIEQGVQIASDDEAETMSLRKAPKLMALRAVAEDEATTEEVKAEAEVAVTTPSEEVAKEEAQSEVAVEEKAAKEEAPVVVVKEATQPVQTVSPKLVPSLQGAVASMSIVSMTQDTSYLEAQALTQGNGLWADVGTNRIEFDGYKGNRSGLFFGGQAKVNDNILIGAAMRYTDGRIKGNDLRKQDWTGYGIGFYGSYTNNGWFGLATASYQNNRAKNNGRVESDSFALSVKGGKSIEAGNFTVTPYVGYRMIRVDTDYADKATVHQIPIGVKVQGNAKTGDWIISPSIDAAFVPQMGDRKIGLKGTGLQSTIASRYAGEARIGVSTTKGKFGAGLYYTGSAGDKGLRSHSIQAQINYAF